MSVKLTTQVRHHVSYLMRPCLISTLFRQSARRNSIHMRSVQARLRDRGFKAMLPRTTWHVAKRVAGASAQHRGFNVPTLSPRQVAAFRATMLTGGITRAATMLHLTQPAVTRLIKEFEVALDSNFSSAKEQASSRLVRRG